ncbi:MAG: nucleotidyltransferase family protein [Proteobacteria bacterium]|nr:nucleotidyltransferase family protein [Pseudomonadota bacterium]
MLALDEKTRQGLGEFCRRRQVRELSLFGSMIRGEAGPESDVDVLLDFAPEARPTLLDLAAMQQELADIFGRPVDLLTRRGMESSPNRLRREAILFSAQVVHAA